MSQNYIDTLVSCQTNCESIDALPQEIQEPLKNLFEFAFELLTKLEIRDEHYRFIYDQLENHVCPFCGFEYFDAPGAPREALDHYLVKSKYPFAAANLRNLVPMGNKCNSRYKLAQDILFNDDGTRRKSFDPYNHPQIKVSFENSLPFAGHDGQLPEWQIDFIPDVEEVQTWDDIFRIRERYKRDILDSKFKNWLSSFAKWFKAKHSGSELTAENISIKIQKYVEDLELFSEDSLTVFKALVFRMIHKNFVEGNQRLIDFICNLLKSTMGLAV